MRSEPAYPAHTHQAHKRLGLAAVLGVTLILCLALWAPQWLNLAAVILPLGTLLLVVPTLRQHSTP